MKKLTLLFLGAVISLSAMADKIGVLNTPYALSNYSGMKAMEAELNNNLRKIEKEIQTRAEKLQKEEQALLAKGNKITVAEKTAFEKKVQEFQKFVADSQRKMNEEQAKKTKELNAKVVSAVKSVVEEEKFDYVFEQGAIISGGEDITTKVLKKLESTK